MASKLSRDTAGGASPSPTARGGQELAKPNYWAVLPAAIRYDPEITPGAKLLYAEISALTDQRGYCWASNAYFLQLYGISEPTVQRYLRALKAGGYITIADGDGGPGRRKIYAGINPLADNPIKNDGVTPSKMTGDPIKNDTRIKKEIKKENDPPKAPQGAAWEPDLFERFWKLYPRKKDRAKAIRAWDKLKADRKLMQTMSAALKAQMATEEWQRDNGRAIPYPSTWLNNRRWEDEVDEDGGRGKPLPYDEDSAPYPERRDVLWI